MDHRDGMPLPRLRPAFRDGICVFAFPRAASDGRVLQAASAAGGCSVRRVGGDLRVAGGWQMGSDVLQFS